MHDSKAKVSKKVNPNINMEAKNVEMLKINEIGIHFS